MHMQYKKKRMAAILTGIFLLAVVVWLGLTFYTNQRIKPIDVSACDRLLAAGVDWKIESINYRYDYLTIKGYAYQPGISVDTVKTTVVIYDAVSDRYYELPTENVKKTKLTKEADDGYNYDYAQFEAAAFQKKIPDGSRIYILYRVNGSEILIETDEAIYF